MIVCKSPAEIERMRAANELVAAVLTELRGAIEPGVSTGQLDAMAEAKIVAAGATPAFKGYHGYPATLCVSMVQHTIIQHLIDEKAFDFDDYARRIKAFIMEIILRKSGP